MSMSTTTTTATQPRYAVRVLDPETPSCPPIYAVDDRAEGRTVKYTRHQRIAESLCTDLNAGTCGVPASPYGGSVPEWSPRDGVAEAVAAWEPPSTDDEADREPAEGPTPITLTAAERAVLTFAATAEGGRGVDPIDAARAGAVAVGPADQAFVVGYPAVARLEQAGCLERAPGNAFQDLLFLTPLGRASLGTSPPDDDTINVITGILEEIHDGPGFPGPEPEAESAEVNAWQPAMDDTAELGLIGLGVLFCVLAGLWLFGLVVGG